ncbi:MAG: hypothetical protein PHD81_04740 [Candidatus Nanoarchaeia archaeon]|nr:hypothetical protein [Candidatus Nanoarchaeia archaeon]MDD5588384.1 hypothetical protein [Candidatus Nanoarchaeia archaeon]
MANKLDANKLGLTLGIFIGGLHLIWALFILASTSLTQKFLDWIFPLHFLNNVWQVSNFNAVYALMLVILTFLSGYVMGWIFAELWNYIDKKVK